MFIARNKGKSNYKIEHHGHATVSRYVYLHKYSVILTILYFDEKLKTIRLKPNRYYFSTKLFVNTFTILFVLNMWIIVRCMFTSKKWLDILAISSEHIILYSFFLKCIKYITKKKEKYWIKIKNPFWLTNN